MTINNNPPCFLQSPDGKQRVGPYTFHQVYQYYANGKLKAEHLMSLDRNSWHKVGQVFASQDAMRSFIQAQQATVFTDDNIILEKSNSNLDSFCALFEDEPQKVDTLVANNVESQDDNIFGNYEILGELGRGGMGVVYKVQHRHMKKTMALKVLLSEEASEKEVKRFMREAKLTAALDHDNIVKIYDYAQQPAPHISMEYVEGQTLGDFLSKKRGRLSEREAAKLFFQICEALTHAHEKKVLHRDLKPGNILITNKGVVKVMDFGLAKPFSLEENEVLSVKGELVGTPQYMSPEQASTKKELDHRSDIYSLGAIFYEMLCGTPPFKGEGNTLSLLFKIIREKITPLKEVKPEIHEDLHLITMKCIEKDREQRYQRCRHIVQDLRKFLHNKPISLRPPGLWERTLIKVREEKKLVLGTAILVGFLGVIGIFFTKISVEQKYSEAEKEFMQRSAEFHNRDFRGDFSKCVALVPKYEYLWMQACTLLIKRKYKEANYYISRVSEQQSELSNIEKNKLVLLRVICAMLLDKQSLAKEYLQKFDLPQPKNEIHIQPYTKTQFRIATYRDFLINKKDAQNQKRSVEDVINEKARYYLLVSLLPDEQSQDAYQRLFFDDENLDQNENKQRRYNIYYNDLYKKYKNISCLLHKPSKWMNLLKEKGDVSFIEMCEVIHKTQKEIWLLDMRSLYWSHLTPGLQGRYAKKYQKAYANSLSKEIFFTENISNCDFHFVLIPPGYFRIGDPHSTFEDGPAFDHYFDQHFWMLQNEVTQKQWIAVMGKLPEEFALARNYVEKHPTAPVTQFKYSSVISFLSKTNFELPDEIYWEYACRSGSTSKWFWKIYGEGKDKDEGNINYKYSNQPKYPISFETQKTNQNNWLLSNMNGNCAELCSNVFNDYKDVIQNHGFDRNKADKVQSVAIRGGHLYADSVNHLSSSSRRNRAIGQLEQGKNFVIGFRVIMRK